MRAIRLAPALLGLGLLLPSAAGAAPITPVFQTFGNLSGATFGGNGIPTRFTAFSDFVDPTTGDTLRIGLSATKRFNNSALGNDGAGTYIARTGQNDGTPGSTAGTLGAVWNFNTYLEVIDTGSAGSLLLTDLDLTLLYDFDPAAGTDETAHGTVDVDGVIAATFAAPPFPLPPNFLTLSQDSQNLDFEFLADVPDSPFITAPAGSFDPFATGEYTFALRSPIGEVAIAVTVEEVPLPPALPLAALGMLMLGAAARRRPRKRSA